MLAQAVQTDNTDVVRELLQAGAEINGPDRNTGWPEDCDRLPSTPLMVAAQRKPATDAAAMVALLLDHDADPNRVDDNGQCALDLALEAELAANADLLTPVTAPKCRPLALLSRPATSVHALFQ